MSIAYDNIIEQVVQSVFATMLGMEVARGDEPAEPCRDTLLATIQITGAWMGSVVIGLPQPVSVAAAAAMMGLPAGEVSDSDEREVAAELVNMIGGNLKSVLPGPSYLSLPTVISGHQVGLQVHDAALIEDITLGSPAGPIHLRLFQHFDDGSQNA